MTKRDKPAMSEEEFEKAIKELAQKEFATGKRDDAAYRKLCMQHGETVSPDRKIRPITLDICRPQHASMFGLHILDWHCSLHTHIIPYHYFKNNYTTFIVILFFLSKIKFSKYVKEMNDFSKINLYML